MKISNSTNRKFGAFLSIVHMAVQLLVGLVYTPICVRFLGQSEYGLITFAQGLISYLSILDMGFGSALVRYSSRLREQGEDESNLYGFFLTLFSVIGLVALTFGIFIYNNLESTFSSGLTPHELQLLKPVFILLLINVIVGFPGGVFSSIISSHEKFILLRSLEIIKSILMHTTNVLFLFMGHRVVTITLVTVSFSILVYLIDAFYCFFNLKIKIGFKIFDKEFYADILKYSFFIFVGMLGGQLYDETDKIILGKFASSSAVAVYGVGVTFYMYFKIMALSITNVFFPMMNKLSVAENYMEKMSSLFNRIGRILIIALGFILVGFTCFGKEFTILWVGEDFIDSYWIALIIMVPNLVPWAQSLGTSVLEALNKHKVNSIMYFLIAILNAVISIPLTIWFGGIGAAIGTAIGTILGRGIFLNCYYKRLGLNIGYFWKNFFEIGLKFIPIIVVFVLSNVLPLGVSWFGLIIKIFVSCCIVAPYIYLVILNKEEKQLFFGWVARFIR